MVESLHRVPGTHRVYNLTVEGEHVYRVAQLGVLVHNNDCWTGSIADGGRKSFHGNDLDAPGPHDVYAVRDRKTGEVLHFGETGQPRTRTTKHVRDFWKKHGRDVIVQPLKTVEGKRAAKALETRYITTFEKVFGKKPPFNFSYH